jgi:hypothetical protein
MQEQKLSKFQEWWDWYFWRARYLASQIWLVISTYTTIVTLLGLVLYLYLYVHTKGHVPQSISDFNMVGGVIMLALPIILGTFFFLLLFFLSLTKWGRKVATWIYRYPDPIEVKKYVEKTDSRLDKIETILKQLVESINAIHRHDVDKYNRNHEAFMTAFGNKDKSGLNKNDTNAP